MPNTQPAPFGELFSSAWSTVRERMNVLLPGVIMFTVLSALTQIPFAGLEQQGAPPTPENVTIAVVASVASMIIGIIAYLYYLLAVTGGDQSVGTILKKTLPRIFPFIGLTLLIILKTFAWLAIIGAMIMGYAGYASYAGIGAGTALLPLGILLMVAGIICGIVLGPRYMLSPILWAVEGKGVSASVKRSYDVSSGYWGKIFGNTLLVGLIFLVIMIGVGIVSAIIGGILGAMAGAAVGGLLAGMLTMFFSQFYNVVLIAFLLKLSATIIVNPRGGPAAPVVTSAAPAAPAPSAPTAPKPIKAAAQVPTASKKPVKKAPAKKPAAKKAAPKKKA